MCKALRVGAADMLRVHALPHASERMRSMRDAMRARDEEAHSAALWQ